MPTIFAEGDQSVAALATVYTLTTATDNANYVLIINCENMVLGDVVEFRIWTKARAASTSRVAYYAVYAHIQAHPNKYSPPVPSDVQLVCTIVQTANATALPRVYPWKLLKVAT